ncbi:MAG: peptide chain release factor N(5)-glutamine methyltransferase [Bacteroidales bacterium]|nr:peptide chain release factor N(5)-glutamine methyltransferase [Bacteroidales bacterium]
MKINELLTKIINQILPTYNGDIKEARAVALRLLAHHLHCKPYEMFAIPDHEINLNLAILNEDISKLKNGMPIQYITNEQEFCGLSLWVKPGVLIPRPETEELLHIIIKQKPTFDVAIDIGTGSGCIALALKHVFPQKRVIAIDIDPTSIEVTQINAIKHQLQIEILQLDIFDWEPISYFSSDERILVISNPPYVHPSERENMTQQVLNFEPEHALFVPSHDPIIYYKTILYKFSPLTSEFYFEVNPMFVKKLKDYLCSLNMNYTFFNDFKENIRFLKVLPKT